LIPIPLFKIKDFLHNLVANCVDSASLAFQSSQEGSSLLVTAIVNHGLVSLADNHAHLDMVHSNVTRCHEDQFHLVFSSVLSGLPSMTSRAVQ